MKNVFIVIFVFMAFALQAQNIKYDTLFFVNEMVTSDTTVFRIFKSTKEGRYLEIDIDSLSANTDSIWVGPALDKTFFGVYSGFPVVANKETYKSTVNSGTKSRVPCESPVYTAKLIAIRYKKVGSTTGCVVLIY